MAKRTKPRKRPIQKGKGQPAAVEKKKGPRNVLFAVLSLAALSLLFYFINEKTGILKRKEPLVLQQGPADYCKAGPAFVSSYGLVPPVALDLRQQGTKGLSLIEAKEQGKVLHLPQWEQAGYLGPHAIDRYGNIFVAPAPTVNLEFNPPEEQNRIYFVSSQTGEMELFLDLPWASPPTANNPFGVVGLTYDCDTESLYAASIAGSGFKDEIGRIFRIDLKNKKVADQLEGIDAIGVGVYNTHDGKRLYFGSARESEIYSVELDENGDFKGEKRFEFSLAAQKGGSFDKGHRIQFFGEREMVVKAIEFSYSLIAASNPKRNIYTLDYDPTYDKWVLRDVQQAGY